MQRTAFGTILILLLASGITAPATPPRKDARIAVVVHPKNPTKKLSRSELRRIFLRKQLVWPGWKTVTVFERPSQQWIRQDFSRAVLGKEPGELRDYWLKLKLTRGLGSPKVLDSPALVSAYLRRVQGGIAYLREDEVEPWMKVVARLDGGRAEGKG